MEQVALVPQRQGKPSARDRTGKGEEITLEGDNGFSTSLTPGDRKGESETKYPKTVS